MGFYFSLNLCIFIDYLVTVKFHMNCNYFSNTKHLYFSFLTVILMIMTMNRNLYSLFVNFSSILKDY